MKKEDFEQLQIGDIVVSEFGHCYVVTGNYGGRVTAAATADLTNPSEWEILNKAHHKGESK